MYNSDSISSRRDGSIKFNTFKLEKLIDPINDFICVSLL